MRDLFPTELVTQVKPDINSVKVHPQLCNNRHPVDGALVGAGSLWPLPPTLLWVLLANLLTMQCACLSFLKFWTKWSKGY
jgi:hypothetical protein